MDESPERDQGDGVDERVTVRRALDRARGQLDSVVAALQDDDFDRPVAAGQWSVRDVLNHVAAWDEVGAESVRELVAGLIPSRYFADVDGFNAEAVATDAARSPRACRAALAAARRAFLAELDAAGDEAWERVVAERAGGSTVSIRTVCSVWTQHDDAHAAELKAYLASR